MSPSPLLRPLDLELPPLPPDIHLVMGGADVGPIDGDAFMRLAADGRIGPATLAWHPALDAWAEIRQLPELAWVLARPVAPQAAQSCRLAGLGRRLAAGSVDMLVWLAAVNALAFPLGLTSALTGASEDSDLAMRFNLMAQIVAAAYFILPMSRIGGGATPGYRLFGLRLVAADDLRAPGAIRTVVWYIVTYVRFVGWLTYFIDSRRRMLHNIVSNTIVIVARGTPS